jgi:hypothetical protein
MGLQIWRFECISTSSQGFAFNHFASAATIKAMLTIIISVSVTADRLQFQQSVAAEKCILFKMKHFGILLVGLPGFVT